jgi:hypothetical protein
VVGAIHLYLNSTSDDGFLDDPNTKRSVESGFQNLIRLGMQEGYYVTGDAANYVSLIGTRVYSGDDDSPFKNVEGGPSSNVEPALPQQERNRVAIVIGAVGVFLIVILSWLSLTFRARSNASRAENAYQPRGGTTRSSLPAGVVDEENSYTIVKSVVNGPSVVPSMMTAGTISTDVEEEDAETGDCLEEILQEDVSDMISIGNETYATGDIKIFQDDGEDEEEEINFSYLDISSGTSQTEAPRAITMSNAFLKDKAGCRPTSYEAKVEDGE